MAANEEIVAKNIKKIKAVINGDVESAIVEGATVYRFAGIDEVRFYYTRGGICVSGDKIKISGPFADLMDNGAPVAYLPLMEV